jgi:AcrR family transcriptional regulator
MRGLLMNTKNNTRAKNTRARIRDAAIDLLQNHSLQQLTVQAICEKSGINRSSFYVHYQDVYDMMEKMNKEHEAEVSNVFLQSGVSTDSFRSPSNLVILIEYISLNRTFYKAYLNGFGYSVIEYGMSELYASLFKPMLQNLGVKDEMARQYHFTFFKCGLLAVIRQWLENGCAESPKTLADIIWKSVPPFPDPSNQA